MKNQMYIMSKERSIMQITWDTDTAEVRSVWLSKPHVKIPRTLYPENISWQNVMKWLETRTVPRTRFDINDVLKRYGLSEYNPYAMCKKSHGLSMSDFIWIRFNNEDICYDDIKIRQ